MDMIISILMFAISAAAIGYAHVIHRERVKMWRALGIDNVKTSIVPKFYSALSKFCARFSPWFAKLYTAKGREKIAALIAKAGIEDNLTPEIFAGMRLILAALSAVLFYLYFTSLGLAGIPIGGLLGWWLGLQRLKSRVRQRAAKIDYDLPHALDWLTLSVEAGLDFAQALSRIAMRMRPSPLKEEFIRLNSEIKMGMTRKDALAALSTRVDSRAVSSFTALLIQADSLGASIGPVLRASASRMRSERFSSAERKGAAAAQKAMLPMVVCIMPTTFIVIFGPLIVKLLTGGFDKMFVQ